MPLHHQRYWSSLTDGLVTVPNSATDVTAVDTRVYQITVANKTASAVTLLVQDKAGTPKTLVPTISLDANSLAIMSFPEGVKMTGGVRWQAGSASALDAEIVGTGV